MTPLRTLFSALALAALPVTALADQQTTSEAAAPADTPAVVEMVLGNPDATVTVKEYASYTCGHCATFHADQFKKLKADYIDTGKIKFIYRDVYFDRVGLWASMVARCDADRFFAVSDLIYSKQGEWLKPRDPVQLAENLKKLGIVAGLSAETVDACMKDADKAKALVDWFQTNAEADEIDATPTLVINGEKHINMPYESLKTLLDEKLGS